MTWPFVSPLLPGNMLRPCQPTDRVHIVPFLLPVANPSSDNIRGEKAQANND